MSNTAGQSKKKPGEKLKTPEEILASFQALRNEQRYLTQKLAEMEMEVHEHKIVIEALKDLDTSRKCFRMIGGVLSERTVGDVLPVLKANTEQLENLINALNKQVVAKGVELNAFKEEYNVRIKSSDEISKAPESEAKAPAGGVLVS